MNNQASLAPQPPLYSDTETYSQGVIGPVYFKLSNLKIEGQSTAPALPGQSPYIIEADEEFVISVDLEFNEGSPLTDLLMCLGTQISAEFAFEGFGAKATEIDLNAAMITTSKDVYNYTLMWRGTPSLAGLTAGFYKIAAVVNVGPAHKCSPKVLGVGYISNVLSQVYDV